MEASQHDIQLEDGDLDELDDNFSDLSDDDGQEDGIGQEPQVHAERGAANGVLVLTSVAHGEC